MSQTAQKDTHQIGQHGYLQRIGVNDELPFLQFSIGLCFIFVYNKHYFNNLKMHFPILDKSQVLCTQRFNLAHDFPGLLYLPALSWTLPAPHMSRSFCFYHVTTKSSLFYGRNEGTMKSVMPKNLIYEPPFFTLTQFYPGFLYVGP